MIGDPFRKFNIYDLLVALIPGSIALFVIYLNLPTSVTIPLPSNSVIVGLIFLSSAYFVGVFVQAFSYLRISRLKMFQEEMQKARNDEQENEVYDKVWGGLLDKFDLPSDFDTPVEGEDKDAGVLTRIKKQIKGKGKKYDEEQTAFWVVQNYLIEHNIGRVKRFDVLYSTYRSLFALSVISMLIFGLGALSNHLGLFSSKLDLITSSVFTVIFGLSGYIFRSRMKKFDHAHDREIIYTFYTNVMETDTS